MTRLAAALIAGLALVPGTASAQVERHDVDIKAPDTANLRGTYFSPGKAGPAILLLHQCNMDRHAWGELAGDLVNAGFHVLTVDFRGYGDSDGSAADADERRALRARWPGDVDAMFAYLVAQPGVDRSRLAAGGASCGVGQSSDLAARAPEIRALIELSGSASDAAKAHVARTPPLAVFGAAAEGDTNSAQSITELVGASKNPQSMLKIYAGTEHGVPMFAKNPDLRPMIVSWLGTQLMSGDSND